MTEIQDALLWAVHEQSLSVDTLIETFPPVYPATHHRDQRITARGRVAKLRDGDGRGHNGQGPARARPLLAATLNATEPFPLPLAPEEIEIHDALLWAVQLQPVGEVTATGAPAPPPWENA